MAQNIVRGTGVSVTASQTHKPVSNPFKPQDRLNLVAHVQLSRATEATAITFQLQDSFDGGNSWYAVGSESSVAVTSKTATAGTAEISTITFPAQAGAAQADYISFTAQDGTTYAAWLDINENGTEPTGAIYVAADVKILVPVATSDTAAEVAASAVTAIGSQMSGKFTIVDNEDGTVTFTQVNSGDVANPVPKDADDSDPGSISVSVGTAGSNGGINISTNAITSTSHAFVDNQLLVVEGSDLPAGLSAGNYYALYVDANTIKLRSEFDGSAVDLTDYGSGTITFYPATYQIRLLGTDSSDIAQLPLEELVRVTCTTSTSDSCTVSAVYIADNA